MYVYFHYHRLGSGPSVLVSLLANLSQILGHIICSICLPVTLNVPDPSFHLPSLRSILPGTLLLVDARPAMNIPPGFGFTPSTTATGFPMPSCIPMLFVSRPF